jgi:hypothetical protein
LRPKAADDERSQNFVADGRRQAGVRKIVGCRGSAGGPDLLAEQIHRVALAELADRIATMTSVADIKA